MAIFTLLTDIYSVKNRKFHNATDVEQSRMAISNCYWHLAVKNGNFTIATDNLVVKNGNFTLATDI